MTYDLHLGDNRIVLRTLPDNSVDITPEYVEIARRRIAHHAAQGTLPI